eukprot:TRINITY_DN72275_c0_g1_i1.p1 TRINITY_DN72275_c0_g1~~TRINITY_DN72275_c0_g1_i1.p1  ORF type:complete len:389 (+),score=87.41 TRINITY_DN72275_c0_g1_i1:37-1203(+)
MGAEHLRREGQLSAWLQKKKSGSSTMRVGQYNKRYFTVDFDSQTYFYAHAENSKKVSAVTPFADILDVVMPETDQSDTTSECSKKSSSSIFRRPTFLSSKPPEESHTIKVMTRPAKTTELVCSSSAEAMAWFEALKAAIAIGNGQAQQAAPSSEKRQLSESGVDRKEVAGAATASTKAPAAAGASAGGYPAGPSASSSSPSQASGGYPSGVPAMPTAAAAAPLPRLAENAPLVQNVAEADDDQEGDVLPPPTKGTFLDLTIEETPAETQTADSRTQSQVDAAVVEEAADIVTSAGPGALQASDFGFGEDQDSDSSSAQSSPRGAASRQEAGKDTGAKVPAAGALTGEYGDKHEGLTMQERLAKLQFSDDEDEDDDDPLGLKQSQKGPT